MAELEKISAESFAALLDLVTPSAASEIGPKRAGLRAHVCLLSAFDAANLPPSVSDGPGDPVVQQFLAEDCERVATPLGERWSLRESVRLGALAALDAAGELRDFVGATDSADTACQMALRYIRGDAPALNRQTVEELRGCVTGVGWLARTSVPVPPLSEVRARLAAEGMLEPLRMLLADGFFGRQGELGRLADYARTPRPGRDEQPPLLIYGPGGAGKSTLVARFILDHFDTAGDRFPFAYLSFDRSELRLEQPLSLLAEAAAQLGSLFPVVADDASRLASAARSLVAATVAKVSSHRATRSSSSYDQEWEGSDEQVLVRRYAALVERAAGPGGVLNVWVLDTFEVAQRQAPSATFRLWVFFGRLRQACPGLRLMLCGRGPLDSEPTVDMPLGALDPVAATEMLRSQLADLNLPAEFLASIVSAVSAQPVSLRIAVLCIRAAAVDGPSSFGTAESRRDLLLGLSGEEVEGVLYRRILDHIEDDDVRRIAHPGLALHRLTPEVIQFVLARRCGLGPVNRSQALQLFYKLGRELSLVEPTGAGGLQVRPVIRRVMLPMIERDNPAQLAALRRAAQRYYAKQDSLPAKVEELYYRLVLGQSTAVLDRAFSDEAIGLLDAPVEEYPASSQVYLANRLGITADPGLLARADDLSWGRQTVLAARRLLDAGQAVEALELLTERHNDVVRAFTAALEVEALATLGRREEALAVASGAADWCAEHQEPNALIDVALLAARINEDAGDFEPACRWLQEAERVAGLTGNRISQLTAWVARLRLHRRAGTADTPAAQAIRTQVITAAKELTARDKSGNPGLVRDLAAEVGDAVPGLTRDALRISGFRRVDYLPPLDVAPLTSVEMGDQASEHIPSIETVGTPDAATAPDADAEPDYSAEPETSAFDFQESFQAEADGEAF